MSNSLLENFSEFLSEFTTDGGQYQLAAGKNWNEVWSKIVEIGNLGKVRIFGGWTSMLPQTHTAVVNITVTPLGGEGAEDKAEETMSIYYKDWSTEEEAKADLQKMKGIVKLL